MTESMDMDTKMQKFDEEIEQILDLLEEKAYFRARDVILTHNEVDIAEILEEILEESGDVYKRQSADRRERCWGRSSPTTTMYTEKSRCV